MFPTLPTLVLQQHSMFAHRSPLFLSRSPWDSVITPPLAYTILNINILVAKDSLSLLCTDRDKGRNPEATDN